jgi:Mn2+/Fe2+ NRAMP family transporter
MINIIFEPALLLGVSFSFLMIFFYSLRFINPDLSTDWDIFITTLGIVYSSILIIHGWRLDPILLFSQVLLIFISFSFCWILIRQREIIRRLIDISEMSSN